MSEHAVLIGACGWQHPQWHETYYPEGLPEDWQLAYYGNEYPVVLIPAAYWSQGREVITSWLTETETRPRFVCEWSFGPGCPPHAQASELIALLGDRVEAVLFSLAAMPDAAQLATMATLAGSYAVCLDWPDATATQLQSVLQHPSIAGRASVCWHAEVERRSDLAQGPLALARVNSEGQTPRSLRTLLETLLETAGERPALLLFDGQPPDLEIVDQAEVILNLL